MEISSNKLTFLRSKSSNFWSSNLFLLSSSWLESSADELVMLNMALQPSFYAILLGSIFPFLRHTDVLFVSRAGFALRVWRYNCYLILFSVPTSSFEKRGPDLFKYIIVLPREEEFGFGIFTFLMYREVSPRLQHTCGKV